jgi:hypothetical protein
MTNRKRRTKTERTSLYLAMKPEAEIGLVINVNLRAMMQEAKGDEG